MTTSTSPYSRASPCQSKSPRDHEESARHARAPATPRSLSSENHTTSFDQTIAAWVLSCPVSLTVELRDSFQDIITRLKVVEQAQRLRRPSQDRILQDCLRHIQSITGDRWVEAIRTPSSISGLDCDPFTREETNAGFPPSDWPGDIQTLLRTCKDLITVSCRLSSTILSPTANSPIQMDTEAPKWFSNSDDVKSRSKEPTTKVNRAAWDVIDSTLPDELGANSFDHVLEMLNSEFNLI